MNYGSYVEDSYRFTSEKLESVSHILLISVKVLEVLLQQALWKFSETAKGWYWNMGKLYKEICCQTTYMLCTGTGIL